MIWANFLHFYQPPTQKKYWVDRVTDESYRRLVKELLANPDVKLTLNVNSVLCDLWRQYGHEDVIEGIKELATRGQIELTGSAKFHPLLPKMSKEEIKRQILLNEVGLKEYFGIGRPKGFFPPEMAYDRYVAEVVAEMGYEWILAEELSYSKKLGEVKYDRVYDVENIPIKIFFRERNLSWKILSGALGTPQLFLTELGERVNRNEFVLTAMDGETFGHHRPGMEKQLFEIYRGVSSQIKSCTISELPSLFPKREAVKTLPSTWALMEHEASINKPFSRWDDPDNEIQRLQWELTRLALAVVDQTDSLASHATAALSRSRVLLDSALHSDQYWWASARPWWSLEMIERGAYELLSSVEATDAAPTVKNQARDLYFKIITTGFDWQRTGKVDELSREEDESVRMLTDRGMPSLPAEELKKMIQVIKTELDKVVQDEQYERAIQLRDRIKELESYKKK